MKHELCGFSWFVSECGKISIDLFSSTLKQPLVANVQLSKLR